MLLVEDRRRGNLDICVPEVLEQPTSAVCGAKHFFLHDRVPLVWASER